MRGLLLAIALTGAAATDCVPANSPCTCNCGNLAEGKNDDGVCIRLGKEEMGVRPNVPKDLCCTRENEKEPGPPGDCVLPRFTEAKPFYYCCVDSEDRPVNPPPEFVGPKIAAWFGFTDKLGCDPCERAKPKNNKQCLYYRDRRTNKKPEKTPKVQWKKDITEQECADLAAADEKVETYWCEEGGGPPKGKRKIELLD